MSPDPAPQSVDWDGLFTLLLTLLVIGLSAGLALFIAYLYVLVIAKVSRCDTSKDSSLLVFGKRLQNGRVDADYRLRLNKALELIAQSPRRRVILLGGSPFNEPLSEAMAGLDYLQARGIENHHILLEQGSRNTLENLRHAREMLRSAMPSPAVLITNRYHLARTRMIASSLGIEHRLCAAEPHLFLTFSVLGKLLFEAFYILWFSTGKTWARLTRNQRMLKRIT